MSRHLSYAIFETAAGWIGLLASPRGLRRITLPQGSAAAARQQLDTGQEPAEEDPPSFAGIIQHLRLYFRGAAVSFPHELDLHGATVFQQRVWQTARKIPHGETRSYGWLAAEIRQPGAARAVGQALGKNPLPVVIPCHRVLAHDGRLGGFSGGIRWKEYLLNLEKTAKSGNPPLT